MTRVKGLRASTRVEAAISIVVLVAIVAVAMWLLASRSRQLAGRMSAWARICTTAAAGLPPAEGEKRRLAILPLAGDAGPEAEVELRTAIVRTGKYSVMERAELDELLSEQKLQRETFKDAESAARAGRLLGVDYAVFGAAEQESLSLDFMMVDVESGEIRWGFSGT